jgi:uncharacterized protein involved in exopolysaccharide biosynthesis
LRVAHFLLSNGRLIMIAALCAALVGSAAALVRPREYVATVAFTPSGGNRGNMGAVSGLASQLGLQLDIPGNGDGLPFYSAFVKSRALLSRLAATKYSVPLAVSGGQPAELGVLLGVGAREPGKRRREILKRLQRMISVRSEQTANIIEVKVTSRSPELSEQLALDILQKVNEFNIERRRVQASAEREFAQERVRDQTSTLEAAEGALAAFRMRNRSYLGSPELSLEHERLQRRVDLQQQVLSSLLQSLERARIEELRNTPVVTPIDLPLGSATPQSRGVVLALFLGLFFGAFLGVAIALARETFVRAQNSDPERYAEVAALVRRPWRGRPRRRVSSHSGSTDPG